LMREKRHWETQIVTLGGANYKRGNQAMVDDDGKEVPGTRGYKYFGRAKELPGVKEMFTKGAQQATEESARNASFQMFRNQGADYYGDTDEVDAGLAEEEDALAREDWEAMVAQTASTLSLPEDTSVPYPSSSSSKTPLAAPGPAEQPAPTPAKSKRKKRNAPAASEPEVETNGNGNGAVDGEEGEEAEGAKKAKLDGEVTNTVQPAEMDASVVAAAQARQAALAASFLGMLDPESLKHPVLPTVEEMGKVLLEVRKNALRAEYGV